MRHSPIAIAGMFALCIAASAARAQTTYLPSDTHINYTIPDYVATGYANEDDYNNFANPTHPYITFETGGSIGIDLIIAGGTTFAMSGGVTPQLEIAEGVTATISGGTVTGYLGVSGFAGFSPTTVYISGGEFGVGPDIANASVFMSGGHSDSNVIVENDATFTMTGGQVDDEVALYGGTANINGGTVGDVVAGDGTANIYGGASARGYLLTRSGALTLFGTDLTDMLVDPHYQLRPGDDFSKYAVSGHLLDGTLLVNQTVLVANSSSGRFSLVNSAVPEPGSLALFAGLALSGAGFARARRVKRARRS